MQQAVRNDLEICAYSQLPEHILGHTENNNFLNFLVNLTTCFLLSTT